LRPRSPHRSRGGSLARVDGAPAAPADNLCNDFTLAPDHALYVSDTLASRICRLRPGAQVGELLIEYRSPDGIDGITFLDGEL
jgi:hypothetical protein